MPVSHGDLLNFFPGAVSAVCDGYGEEPGDPTGGWATVTYPEPRGVNVARCPQCRAQRVYDALTAATPPRFRADIVIPRAAQEWAARGPKAQGLYLHGPVGTGKTHAAWAAARMWCGVTGTVPRAASADGLGRGPNIVFTRMTDLLDDLRPSDGEGGSRRRIRECQYAELLVLDDVGAEKASEWTQERLYSLIDHRYVNCLPVIVTSNLSTDYLAEQTGERVASRIAGMCTVVPMTGPDRRYGR